MAARIPLPASCYDALLRPTHADALAATGVDLARARRIYEAYLLDCDCFEAWTAMVTRLFERRPEPRRPARLPDVLVGWLR
jgi:hypothetical protein